MGGKLEVKCRWSFSSTVSLEGQLLAVVVGSDESPDCAEFTEYVGRQSHSWPF